MIWVSNDPVRNSRVVYNLAVFFSLIHIQFNWSKDHQTVTVLEYLILVSIYFDDFSSPFPPSFRLDWQDIYEYHKIPKVKARATYSDLAGKRSRLFRAAVTFG